jgi:hypothetical protein
LYHVKQVKKEIMEAINKIIEHTNNRISAWYLNAKKDYNVIGSGKAEYKSESNEIVINYNENGESKVFNMVFYPEYTSNGYDWVFNCWAEQ